MTFENYLNIAFEKSKFSQMAENINETANDANDQLKWIAGE